MKMGEQLSYRANKSWRPQATIIEEESIDFIGVCFSWGEMELSNKVFENSRFFVEACRNQSEITNPFGYEQSLSGLENALRAGCSLANDIIFRLYNKATLTGGVECALISKRGREIAIAQVGQPHIFLKRQSQIFPLLTSFDLLPKDFSSGEFIPGRLLGVEPTCYPHLRSFHYEEGDELILLAHSLTPRALWCLNNSSLANSGWPRDLFQKIANETPESPFWLSKIQI
jgi:hypothetical protein